MLRTLSSLCLCLPLVSYASAYNGYFIKNTGANHSHYDAFANVGSPTVDGIVSVGEWDARFAEYQYKFDRADNGIRYQFQYDANNLYVLVQVDDDKVWVDSGVNLWETWHDDGVEIFIDPNNSRDQVLLDTDRVLALTASAHRRRFDKGNNAGSTQFHAEVDGSVQYKTSIQGTANDNSDTDQGYTIEVAFPWTQLGLSAAPAPFSPISSTIQVMEDDDGGNFTNSLNLKAVDVPQEVDRYFKWSGDGLQGPAQYARVLLLPANDVTAPAPVSNVSIVSSQPFSAKIHFTSSGNDGAQGQAANYQIRYATQAILTEADWQAATVYNNSFVPKIAGQTEQLRILGLAENSNQYIAIRAVDHAGNLSPLQGVNVTTTTAPAGYGKGRIYPSSLGRYFVYENGEAFMPVSQPAGITWLNVRDLYTRPLYDQQRNDLVNWSNPDFGEVGNVNALVSKFAGQGVNLVRLFIEDLAFADFVAHPNQNGRIPDGVSYLEYPASTEPTNYVPETLKFLDDFLALCAQHNIYVVITPWDNYFYRQDIFASNPYNVANGGMLSDREGFVTDPVARNAQLMRLNMLYNIINKHHNFFGWEMMNEWDNNTFAERNDNSNSWRAPRMAWIQGMLSHLRTIDSERMIFVSSVIEQPQNDLQDFVLQSDLFDFVAIHNYPRAVSDPTESGDTVVTVRPATDAARTLRYMLGNTEDKRPVYNLEFGPIDLDAQGTYYDPRYQQTDDETTYHNIIWASFATGEAGMPLRWPSRVLEDQGPSLTATMNAYQANMSQFFKQTQIDFAQFAGDPWDRHIQVSHPNVIDFSNSDGAQGLLYLLADTRKGASTLSGVNVTVNGLSAGDYQVEYWDTYSASPSLRKENMTVSGDTLALSLASIEKDVMISFKKAGIGTSKPPVEEATFAVSQSSLSDGDLLRLSLPTQDPSLDRYVVIQLPDGATLFIVKDKNALLPFDPSSSIATWQGTGSVALELPVSSTIPRGAYIAFLVELPKGLDVLSNSAQWQVKTLSFNIQ